MLKSTLFDQAFARIKDYLPDLTIREKVRRILEEYDIVTQHELENQLKHVENMREQLQALEERIQAIEKDKTS